MQRKVRLNTRQEAENLVSQLALADIKANVYKGHREFVVQYDEPGSIVVDVDLVLDLRND